MKKYEIIATLAGAAFIAVMIYGAYGISDLSKEKISILSDLSEERVRNAELLRQSIEQQAVIDAFQGQIQNIGNTVGRLQKLANTDEELLKKYSKVYFLNENYVPSRLTEIEDKYLLPGSSNFLIHNDVWPYLKRLLEGAEADGVKLLIASAFRSFDTQASLKSGYKVLYGSGANQFSADQGYSEHQLGTTVDFTTEDLGANFSRFQDDTAYKWLKDNAYKHGFILSYPEGNAYYKFEPWHWRFVGVDLATFLRRENKSFYDVDQREIDAYLVKIFD